MVCSVSATCRRCRSRISVNRKMCSESLMPFLLGGQSLPTIAKAYAEHCIAFTSLRSHPGSPEPTDNGRQHQHEKHDAVTPAYARRHVEQDSEREENVAV